MGRCLRDHEGKWIVSFSFNMGKGTILAAEVCAIIHGLHIAWAKGVMNLI